MSHWATHYIGMGPERIGYCWGLLRAVYEDCTITLPTIEGLTRENAEVVAGKFRASLLKDWEEVSEPFEFAGVGMSQIAGEKIHHVGVYTTADGGRIVHCWGEQRVIAENLKSLKRKGFKVIKFYKHKSWPT